MGSLGYCNADFHSADKRNADFHSAGCRNADFQSAGCRNADFQSAVSQNSVLRGARKVWRAGVAERPPIRKSAIQQVRKPALRGSSAARSNGRPPQFNQPTTAAQFPPVKRLGASLSQVIHHQALVPSAPLKTVPYHFQISVQFWSSFPFGPANGCPARTASPMRLKDESRRAGLRLRQATQRTVVRTPWPRACRWDLRREASSLEIPQPGAGSAIGWGSARTVS
jgi:hypothetical protein